jgi:hypothetical protein
MEEAKLTKPKILAKLTRIQQPHQALYLTENKILINDIYQCSIVDPTTNKEITKIGNNFYNSQSCISVHPNRTKFAFAMYHHAYNDTQPNESHQKITIYDAQTCQVEHTAHLDCSYIYSLHFSQLDDTIAITSGKSGDVKIYNYKTKQLSSITVKEAEKEYHSHYGGINYNDMTPIISLHPMQPLISIAWQNIYLHNLETSIRTPISCGHVQHCFCKYSPDGSFIVKHTPHSHMSIIRPNQNAPLTIISEQDENSCFTTMAIHPNNKVLVTLSRKNVEFWHHIIKYWDINNTSKPIATIALLNNESFQPSPSFSPNGRKLLVIMKEKCFEFKVPFKVIYKDITKKGLLYRLCVLKNYMDTLEIPEDIKNLLTYTFHEICKR